MKKKLIATYSILIFLNIALVCLLLQFPPREVYTMEMAADMTWLFAFLFVASLGVFAPIRKWFTHRAVYLISAVILSLFVLHLYKTFKYKEDQQVAELFSKIKSSIWRDTDIYCPPTPDEYDNKNSRLSDAQIEFIKLASQVNPESFRINEQIKTNNPNKINNPKIKPICLNRRADSLKFLLTNDPEAKDSIKKENRNLKEGLMVEPSIHYRFRLLKIALLEKFKYFTASEWTSIWDSWKRKCSSSKELFYANFIYKSSPQLVVIIPRTLNIDIDVIEKYLQRLILSTDTYPLHAVSRNDIMITKSKAENCQGAFDTEYIRMIKKYQQDCLRIKHLKTSLMDDSYLINPKQCDESIRQVLCLSNDHNDSKTHHFESAIFPHWRSSYVITKEQLSNLRLGDLTMARAILMDPDFYHEESISLKNEIQSPLDLIPLVNLPYHQLETTGPFSKYIPTLTIERKFLREFRKKYEKNHTPP